MNCILLFSFLCRSLEEYVNDDESMIYFIDFTGTVLGQTCFALWASDIHTYVALSATLVQIFRSKNKATTIVL